MVQIDRIDYIHHGLVYCDTLLLSLIYDTHETNIHRKTKLYQTSYIYIYQSIYSGPLDFDVFKFYCILDFRSKGSYQIASIFDI